MTPYLQQKALYPPLIPAPPAPDLDLVVVIPAYDEPSLLECLSALKTCELPPNSLEVIVIVNEPDNAPVDLVEKHRATVRQARHWAAKNGAPRRRFHILHQSLPSRHAGVGLARKVGMDEACRRLEQAGHPQGIIACFDADSRCDPNYLQAVTTHFHQHPDCPACSIYFEHPLSGEAFPPEVYRAIAGYELHLRYYLQAQRWAGFPHAFHTVGSSMAVRGRAYQKMGGMNKRKAGEDFYFIHKFTPLPGFTDLTSTRVIPSPRPSHRVPFGTGKAVQEICSGRGFQRSYHPESFIALRALPSILPRLYASENGWENDLPSEELMAFLTTQEFAKKVSEIIKHTASYPTFRDRFFRWFNAFRVMKYLHFARERGRADVPVTEAAAWLLEQMGSLPDGPHDILTLLEHYRRLDRATG